MTEKSLPNPLEEENHRLKRAIEELSVLNDLARAIGAEHDSQEIMHTIIRRSLRAIHGEQGVITLSDEPTANTGHTLVRANVSSSSHPQFHAPQALLGWMQLNKSPLVVNNPETDERFRGVSWGMEVRSILCVPLIARSELIGILTIYNKKETVGFSTDDQRLLAIIAAQSAQVIENARLYEKEKTLFQMEHDVRMALRIQNDLLPQSPPVCAGYDIVGMTTPAKVVGGDYFDFIPLDNRRLAFCLGDVTGKGLPASLLMANLQATIRGQSHLSSGPAECMHRSNTLLYHSTSPEKFATLFYGHLDFVAHTLTYSNAGHEHPALISLNGAVQTLEVGGLMLGAFDDFPYNEATVGLQTGDVLVIFSDGITEAMNADGELFGTERLLKTLQDHRGKAPREIADAVITAVHEHVLAHPQSDDITLVILRRTA